MLAPPSLAPSAPSEYLCGAEEEQEEEEEEGQEPRGVQYNPDTTGLKSGFSSSSSSGGSVVVSVGMVEVKVRGRRWSV